MLLVHRVHKIKLSPNNKQRTYFFKAAGTARFAYNWVVAEWGQQYASGEKPNEVKLRKQFNAIKEEKFPWVRDVTKVAVQQGIKNAGVAFERFLKKQSKYPRFKKKGIHDSFRADNGPNKKGAHAVPIEGKKIKLPRIGSIKMTEELRFTGQVLSATISRQGKHWFASIAVVCDTSVHERKNHGCVGVDVGIKTLATLSNGEQHVGPKAHTRLLKVLRKKSISLARKKKGSRNRTKAKSELAQLHLRISSIRNDSLHKLTTELVNQYCCIGIEDLNVKGMAANRCLARSTMDQSFHEIRRQLTYKCELQGGKLVVVDRFYPSSKLCNQCGLKNNMLTLKDRFWTCECGITHDRDVNAAINIEMYMRKQLSTASYAGIYACGAEGSGMCFPLETMCETMPRLKQEFNPKVTYN